MTSDSVREEPAHPSWFATLKAATWQLITATVGACFRYRVTGLAAEAAFFAILSLPPLVFGLTSSISYLVDRADPSLIPELRANILDLAGRALTDDSVRRVVRPTIDMVLTEQRFDVISLGFVLALWSGSRALNVFVDTITIMYGLGGQRGIVRTRVLSFSLYVVGLVVGVVVLPLVLAGPRLVDQSLPEQVDLLNALYWPIVILLSIAFLTSLYHLSVPVRTSWRYDIPGAVLAFVIWVAGSWLLREILQRTETSVFGPLAAPIAVLIWLYVTSIAVLIGAALNASMDRLWPEKSTSRARLELVRRLRRRLQDDDRPRDIDDI
jgi:membrane protein